MFEKVRNLFGFDPIDECQEDEEVDEFGEMAGRVQQICQVAAMSAENLGDNAAPNYQYEFERYKRLRNEAIAMTMKIYDEYFQGFAICQIAKLCKQADDLETVRPLFDSIEDEFLREQVLNECPELSEI